jgi:acid phosphatase family membrane protein YuiD
MSASNTSASNISASNTSASTFTSINQPLASADPAPKPLKENLGHTRLEVLIGALMGPLVALPGLVLLGSPLHLAQGLGWFNAVG